MQINISEIISTDYKVQTFNPEIEMEAFCLECYYRTTVFTVHVDVKMGTQNERK